MVLAFAVSLYADAAAMRARACASVGLPFNASSISVLSCASPNWSAQLAAGQWPYSAGRLCCVAYCCGSAVLASL